MRDDDWPPPEEDAFLPAEVLPVAMEGAAPTRLPTGLRYGELYRFVFTSPHWVMNLLAGLVCLFVPVVGPIVLIGYGYEIVEALHLWGGRRYPDFDTARLGAYLARGVWPFLVTLILMLIFMLPLALLLFLGVLGLVFLANNGSDPAVLIVGGVILFLAMIGLSLLMQVVLIPFHLRAGLKQELALSDGAGFAREFVRRTWKEMLLGSLYLTFTGVLVECAGLLLCYVGLYPAVVLVILAQQHLLYQLYQVYLGRGGAPIHLKREQVKPSRPEWDDE